LSESMVSKDKDEGSRERERERERERYVTSCEAFFFAA
jgi:hypothetical protein